MFKLTFSSYCCRCRPDAPSERRLLMRSRGNFRAVFGLIAKAIAAACLSLALLVPANAQFWGSWGYPQRQQPRQSSSPFGGWFGQPEYRPREREREREAPVDYSRGPAPPR